MHSITLVSIQVNKGSSCPNKEELAKEWVKEETLSVIA